MKVQLPFKTAALCVAAFALAAVTRASADDATTYNGVSATPAAAALRATVVVGGSGLTRSLAIEEQGVHTGARVRSFDVDMQKRIHLIIVSEDLSQFMHIHPTLDSAGTFRITTTFPGPGVYHLYADTDPAGFGHAVFRFDVPVGDARPATSSRRFSPIDKATVGDYVVRLSTDRVKASVDTPMLISIMKDGEPASDLHPYLGAYAHIVAIGAADLSYTHIHAMDMDSMMSGAHVASGSGLPASAAVPATMPVHIVLPHPGLYKVWVEFTGGSRVYAAPFVLSAR
ncbi:MAG TPA: hypothetical protein VFO25_00250 [Candidatus Eremiobacteraceae bacterium]|nr:hypothetical protein [Candidatus Eremiobacteraceae bacterium]